MSSYGRRFIVTAAVTAVSALVLLRVMRGDMAAGDMSMWPWALGSFVVFAVSAPLSYYYWTKRNTTPFKDKQAQALKQVREYMKEDNNNGKK